MVVEDRGWVGMEKNVDRKVMKRIMEEMGANNDLVFGHRKGGNMSKKNDTDKAPRTSLTCSTIWLR